MDRTKDSLAGWRTYARRAQTMFPWKWLGSTKDKAIRRCYDQRLPKEEEFLQIHAPVPSNPLPYADLFSESKIPEGGERRIVFRGNDRHGWEHSSNSEVNQMIA
jgi:hypothetical protein